MKISLAGERTANILLLHNQSDAWLRLAAQRCCILIKLATCQKYRFMICGDSRLTVVCLHEEDVNIQLVYGKLGSSSVFDFSTWTLTLNQNA
jgi:hypothetical protein